GKTPLVIWLAGRLQRRGLTVGVISRGYGRARGGARRLHSGSRWEEVGDEPLLIHRRTGCPLIVAEDRASAARRLAADGVDVILSDDGLQHLRLARDLEIVVIDGVRGMGNGQLLPAGPLREPASRALDAGFVIVNGEAAVRRASLDALLRERAGPTAAMHLGLGEACRLDGGSRSQPLERFAPGPVHAVAGIGHPARFFGALKRQGLRIVEHAYPDHHPFARGELDFPDELPILMTEKDAVRCASFATPRQWYVPVEAQLAEADAAALLDLVSERIKR
ncbi:MAG: tetraacyldisaccharide 4'-kinase, partial [Steroidobacteraceae bacterium]